MSTKKGLLLLFSLVFFTLSAIAQEQPQGLPAPMVSNQYVPNDYVSESTRDVIYATSRSSWISANPNFPYYNANGITYTIEDFGPDATPYFYDYKTNRGSCTILDFGWQLYCNFGSSIPSDFTINLSYVVAYPDGSNWSATAVWWQSSVYYYTRIVVARPYTYASNIVQDPSAEVLGIPSWKKNGASRACNTDTKIVSSDGICAIKLDNNLESAVQTIIPTTPIGSGDILWISYDVMGKSLELSPKVLVYWTDSFGKTRKVTIKTGKGTFSYDDWWVSYQISHAATTVKIKLVGGGGGKTFFDDIELLVIHPSDLMR